MAFCEKCGTKLGEGASFCGSCGVKIATTEVNRIDIDALYNEAFNAGLKCYKSEQRDKAIEYFTEAIQLKPDSVDAYVNRAAMYNNKQDFYKAIADFTEAIRLRPDHHMYRDRGDRYIQIGEYAKAVADYEVALKSDPNNADTKNNLAVAKRRLEKE